MGTPAGAKAEGVTMMGYREWRERNRNHSSAFLWSPPCREFLFPELYLGTNKSHSLVLIFVQHFVFRAVWLTGWCSPFTKISLHNRRGGDGVYYYPYWTEWGTEKDRERMVSQRVSREAVRKHRQETFLPAFLPSWFWLRCAACGILVPRPGIEPIPPCSGRIEP